MTVQLPTAAPRLAPASRPAKAGDGTETQSRATRRPAAPESSTSRRLSPRLRKWLVGAHVLIGVGWFGITAAKLVLEVVAATADDRNVTAAGFIFMTVLDRLVFPPVAIATLITGVVLSIGTAWGLFRHWWIVIKLVLTVGVVVTGVVFVGAWTEEAAAMTAQPATGLAADSELSSASLRLIGGAVTHLLMLGAATLISVLKPWGRIRPDRQDAARRTAPPRTT